MHSIASKQDFSEQTRAVVTDCYLSGYSTQSRYNRRVLIDSLHGEIDLGIYCERQLLEANARVIMLG